MPRKRSSKIRRAIRAAEHEQNRILRREANAQQRREVIQPQAIQPHLLEERIRQAEEIFKAVQDLRHRIPLQLLPPVKALARQAAEIQPIPNVIQHVPPKENEDVLQLAHEEDED